MADPIYWLSQADQQVLREIVKDFRNRPKNPTNRYGPTEPDSNSSDVYVVRTPPEGIPGLNEHSLGTGSGSAYDDDEPGYADCQVYRLINIEEDEPGIERVEGLTKRVFNLDTSAVEGGKWMKIEKEKFGAWLADESGCASGSGWTTCLKRVTAVRCVDDGWEYDAEFDYYDSCGRYLFTSDTPCPGSAEGTNCCEFFADTVPPNLTSTVTNKTGCLTDLPDTIEWEAFEYDPSGHPGIYRWKVSASTPFTACSVASTVVDSWFIEICGSEAGHASIALNGEGSVVDEESTCDPFSATFAFDDMAGTTATITVSEA